MSHILEDLQQFLANSPTSWHAAREIGNRLAAVDFTPLEEGEKWRLEKGGKYFVQRGGSICAFTLPSKSVKGLSVIASHTDSPALKLKPRAEICEAGMTVLGTEIYGGPLLNSWLNRDLAIAGRVMTQNEKGEIEKHLVFFEEAPLFIPQIAIHLDKEVNEKGLVLDKQDHLRPIASLKEEGDFIERLLRKQIHFSAILSFDLLLVPIEPPRFVGSGGEMLASYRIDNLASAHACMAAIASAKSKESVQVALFWDHEEIGSRTQEGAASSFFSDIFHRIALGSGISEEDTFRLKANALSTSVDVAHAFNPNFSSKYDPNHRSMVGKGIVIKHNADKKYASDATTAAVVIQACQKLSLSHQLFTSRSNVSCGSTVGPIIAHQLGIATVDIGVPIFSMHATREVMGCQDHLDMCQLLTHLLEL